MSGIKHFVNYLAFDDTQMASLLFLQGTFFHTRHSLILCLSRADISPGRSTEVLVKGPIRNIQQAAIIQFSARPFWAPYPPVNRAVYLSVGLPPVSTFTQKKGHFHALLWISFTCIPVILKQTFAIATFINQQYVMVTFTFILLFLFYK
jgi:hypothetical protein